MKLNIWQWLGVVLLVVSLALWFMRERNEQREAEFGTPSTIYVETDEEPTTEPLGEPADEPAAESTTAPS